MNETIQITTEFIRLDALLKLGGALDTGGQTWNITVFLIFQHTAFYLKAAAALHCCVP